MLESREHLLYLDVNQKLTPALPKQINSRREEALTSACTLPEGLALKALIVVSTTECLRMKTLNSLKKIIYVMYSAEPGMRPIKTTIRELGLSIRNAELSL
jgi:hypothetical protein